MKINVIFCIVSEYNIVIIQTYIHNDNIYVNTITCKYFFKMNIYLMSNQKYLIVF